MPKPRIGLALTGPLDERFTITDFLGNGAFGEVYRAVGDDSGRVVAVKLLPIGELADNTSEIALMQEVKAAMQVTHPNVVQVLHVADTDKELGPFVMMEYVPEGTLAKIIARQQQASAPIPLPRMSAMMIDIAQGARAINQKLVHRDIKPDNILYDGTHLKIGDFGISKFVDQSTRMRTFKGGQHPAYMAPEGWRGEANTAKLDTYSVGIVSYQIAALVHPFASLVKDPGDWRAWERVHLFEPCADVRKVRSDVPLEIAQLIQRMAAKRPSERPEWDEVMKILTTPDVTSVIQSRLPSVTSAVEAALRKKEQQDKVRLAAEEQHRIETIERDLYIQSCKNVIGSFEPVIQSFNDVYQHGAIKADGGHGIFDQIRAVTYEIPFGKPISIRFFENTTTGIKVLGGEIIGGGFIGIDGGKSANLVLVRAGSDDLYGKWMICEIDFTAVFDPRSLIGQFGITENTITPFGFELPQHFFDQIRHAVGGLHVFTYKFRDDVPQYFVELLAAACA